MTLHVQMRMRYDEIYKRKLCIPGDVYGRDEISEYPSAIAA